METSERRPIIDLTDEEARRSVPLKWDVPEDVIPAWVAEMDYAVDPVVLGAVQQALADGITGYPVVPDPALATSYAAWAGRHFGWAPEPEAVHPVVDVTAGVRLAIDVFSGPGGVVFPTPGSPSRTRTSAVPARAWSTVLARSARSPSRPWSTSHRTAHPEQGARTILAPGRRAGLRGGMLLR